MTIKDGGDGEDLDELARAVCAVDQPLDEVARVRMQARILAAAPAGPSERATAPRLGRLALALGLGLGLGAAGAALTIRAGRAQVSAGADRGAGKGDSRSVTHLEVPAGSTIHTVLAGRARLTLIGPGEVDLVSASAEMVAIRLPAGVLVGEYDHRGGGTLRIDSPGATTEIVGTRFAIEASTIGSRVSVARGLVSVRDAAHRLQMVGEGQSWSSAQRTVGGMGPEVLRLFETSDASPARATGPSGTANADTGVTARAPAAGAAGPPVRAADSTAVAASGSPSVHASAIVTAQQEAPRARPTIARIDPIPPPLPATSPPAQAPPPLPLPSAPTAPVKRAEDSPEILYAEAETAMRNGDLPAAQSALERVVRTGAAPAAVAARYELARLAMRAGNLGGAARLLDEMLAADRAGALREPARFLRCRVELDRGPAGDAAVCLRQFLQDYPRSAHAAAARQMLDQASP